MAGGVNGLLSSHWTTAVIVQPEYFINVWIPKTKNDPIFGNSDDLYIIPVIFRRNVT